MLKRLLGGIILLLALSSRVVMAQPSIAVLDFSAVTDAQAKAALQIPVLLSDGLARSGKFIVVEREKLHSVMREQEFSASGFVDPATAISLGNLLGAKYLLVGDVVDLSAEGKQFNGYGISTAMVIFHLKVAAKLLDTSSGKVVYSVIKEGEQKVQSSQGLGTYDNSVIGKLSSQVTKGILQDLLASSAIKNKGNKAVPQSKVKVHITSSPGNADVEVDGVFYGNARGDMEIPEGMHLVKISLPGFEEWNKKVMVSEGLRIHAALKEKSDK